MTSANTPVPTGTGRLRAPDMAVRTKTIGHNGQTGHGEMLLDSVLHFTYFLLLNEYNIDEITKETSKYRDAIIKLLNWDRHCLTVIITNHVEIILTHLLKIQESTKYLNTLVK